MSHCIGSEIDCIFVNFYEEVECETEVSAVLRCFDGQQLSDFGPSLVVLPHSFSHLNFADQFGYWSHDCACELPRPRCSPSIFEGGHNAVFFAIPLSRRLRHYVEPPSW